MNLVLVTPPPLLEIVWISLNDFDAWYYLCDITLETGRMRIHTTQDQQPDFPTGIQTLIKAGNLIKDGNADTGFYNELKFYFFCLAPNI
jgi:hypothetical protein